MTQSPRLRVGACLSLSGRYARFGTQARLALQIWQTTDEAELIVEDDHSDPDVLENRLHRLIDRCDVILGPYSTQLMRRAGTVAATRDRLLWNHGGSGDDVESAHPGHIVSILTPTSGYAEPFVRRVLAPRPSRELWIAQGRGRFGRQVADGAEEVAHSLGIPTNRLTPDEPLPTTSAAWSLLCAGSFEEDIARVLSAQASATPPEVICAVAAGVHEFGEHVTRPTGIYGIGQWFPGGTETPHLGMTEEEFVESYRRAVGASPDYPAVQAAATATIAAHCTRHAQDPTRAAVWRAALDLETTTMFGRFKIDQHGVQTGHQAALTRWTDEGLSTA
ncbi:ABC transporter substrate-binding protein [Nonomuraea longicatena]|uniref:Leucine-binding protein domain-containing protein n=1 Tax=Nonomuraea longicatena TaxID=83682 RepID=A0ABP4BTG3_9ACTN